MKKLEKINDLFEKFSMKNDKLSKIKGGSSSGATGDTCSDKGEGSYSDDCDTSPKPIIVVDL